MIIECKNLCKTYGKGSLLVKALDEVNFSVEEGSFVAIMGASGSGKSTLMHLLGGLDHPTSGDVIVDGQLLSAMGEEALAIFRRRKIGKVYQFFNLIPTLTVRKNILLPYLLDGKKYEPHDFLEIVQSLGLEAKLDAMPFELSGGQQQRVAIARSMIHRPAILLADEPTGNLDKKNSQETIALLKRMHQKFKQTMILITHDETVALEADRIIQVEDGKFIRDEVIRL